MTRYGIAKPTKKDATGAAPEYLRKVYDVIDVPLQDLDVYRDLPWEDLQRVVGTDGVRARRVTGGERVVPGHVWLRQGTKEDGGLDGRVLLYQQGSPV